MTAKMMFFVMALALTFSSVMGQKGIGSELKEIKFSPDSSSATVAGSLMSGREAHYFFKAKKGQQFTVRSPRWNMFDFRVFSEENFPDGDFDSSPSYTFEIPETGDYKFFVRKKMAAPRSARFSMTITLK